MNKQELLEKVSDLADLSKAEAQRALDAILHTIKQAIAKGESVGLIGFGTFKSTKRKARTGKNPKTGAPLKIPAMTVPKFSAGAALKAAAQGKIEAAKKLVAKKPAAKAAAKPAAKKPAAKPAAKKPAAKPAAKKPAAKPAAKKPAAKK
jgi:DNA-binding protein HU-beta